MKNRLQTIEEIKCFMFAGKAIITLESKETSNHFTYCIYQSRKYKHLFWVSLLSGPNNLSDYRILCCINSGRRLTEPESLRYGIGPYCRSVIFS